VKEVASTAFFLLHVGFFLGSFFDPENRGDMFVGTSVDFQRNTQRYIPEDRNIHMDICIKIDRREI
jgi:hypothetical protein